MTILNIENDGFHPQLIILFRFVAKSKSVSENELLESCSVDDGKRLRSCLTRWTQLGLFTNSENSISINDSFAPNKKESIDNITNRLPSVCREILLTPEYCLPLWSQDDRTQREYLEQNVGTCADFVRAISWLLSQDIYTFKNTWENHVADLEKLQVTSGKWIFANDTRFNGLRFWARYVGFAIGEGSSFFIDPTSALRQVIPTIFQDTRDLRASQFLEALSMHLPVIDSGSFRNEVEEAIKKSRPRPNHLSMSLSYALRRLELDQVIALDSRADTGDTLSLTGKDDSTWRTFTHVRLQGQN
ncbi:MAG: protein DpdG [Syntrophus sp. (in: bacteria)]|jgi:hypothetical protein